MSEIWQPPAMAETNKQVTDYRNSHRDTRPVNSDLELRQLPEYSIVQVGMERFVHEYGMWRSQGGEVLYSNTFWRLYGHLDVKEVRS